MLVTLRQGHVACRVEIDILPAVGHWLTVDGNSLCVVAIERQCFFADAATLQERETIIYVERNPHKVDRFQPERTRPFMERKPEKFFAGSSQ